MKKLMLTCAAILAFGAAFAAPAKGGKSAPVCADFPDWQGLTDKNWIWGRQFSPSDLRHKVTVVVEFENASTLQGLLVQMDKVFRLIPALDHSIDWMTADDLFRDYVFILCNRGPTKDHESIVKTLFSYKGDDTTISSALQTARSNTSGYDNIEFTGSPDTTGKRPYFYVMGPTGKEPIFQGEVNAANIKAMFKPARDARAAMHKEGNNWEQYFGMLPEDSKYRAQIAKALEKQKPLEPVAKAILKDVQNKDEAVAKEAQMAYDALYQARSDLRQRIMLEYRDCPHRARCDMDVLFKLWPMEKKNFEKALAFMKTMPEADQLYKMLKNIRVWSKPEFKPKNAGEVKKILAELAKMKKILEKLKESKTIAVQNGALLLDGQIDELTGTIPALLETK